MKERLKLYRITETEKLKHHLTGRNRKQLPANSTLKLSVLVRGRSHVEALQKVTQVTGRKVGEMNEVAIKPVATIKEKKEIKPCTRSPRK